MIVETETSRQEKIHDRVMSQLSTLIENAELQTWRRGQVIFYSDHQPLGVYILEKGRIALEFPEHLGKEPIIISEKHCIMGLDFLLASIPYPFSARAVTSVNTWFVSRHQVLGICRDSKNK